MSKEARTYFFTMDLLRTALKQKLIIATIIGASAGIVLGLILKQLSVQPWSERDLMYLKFPGELFMRLVNCLILPLITSSIVSATCNVTKSGRIGLLALYYYTTTTVLGIVLSVVLVQTIKPGRILRNENVAFKTTERYYMTIDTLLDLLRNLIPDNLIAACLSQYQTVLKKPDNSDDPIEEWPLSNEDITGTNVLGLVFLCLLIGLAIGSVGSSAKPLYDFFQALSEVMMKIMDWVIMAVPLSVFCLISGKILEVNDFGTIMQQLGIYVLTVFSGLIVQGFILLPFVYFITTRCSPYKIIAKIGPALVTACGTSSSTATVPVTIKCLDKIGIDKRVSRFIVPIGATINMDGIALYETIGAIFIIQLRGLEFSLMKIIVISITCTISCIGAAGLPNGGYVMLIIVLNSVGVPAEDVSLIIAIDWFVDRFRTTINIITDALGAGIISHYCKRNIENKLEEERKPMNANRRIDDSKSEEDV